MYNLQEKSGGTATLPRSERGHINGDGGGGNTTNATLMQVTRNLPPDRLRQDASQIYSNVQPLINKDPLYHIWNEVKLRKKDGDPEAKFIVRMVRSGTRPLTYFFDSAIETFYGVGSVSVHGST